MLEQLGENGTPEAEDDRDEAGSDGKRRSGVTYPYFSLEESLEFARTARSLGGNEVREEELLKELKLSRSTKSWAYKLSSAREFGLIQKTGRKQEARVALTDLARKLLLPGDDAETEAAKLAAFLNPQLYKGLYKRYAGATVPPVERLANVLQRDFFLLDTVAKTAAEAFIASAKWVGLVTPTNDLLEPGAVREATPAANPVVSTPADVKPDPPPASAAPLRTIQVPEGFAVYGYQLRKDMRVDLALPMDLSAKDVKRLHRWLETLPVDDIEDT